MDSLGNRIRQLRNEENMRQEDLAKILFISRNALAQYERNKRTPNVDMLKKISAYYHVSLEYLLATTELRFDPNDEIVTELLSLFTVLDKQSQNIILNKIKNSKEVLNVFNSSK